MKCSIHVKLNRTFFLEKRTVFYLSRQIFKLFTMNNLQTLICRNFFRCFNSCINSFLLSYKKIRPASFVNTLLISCKKLLFFCLSISRLSVILAPDMIVGKGLFYLLFGCPKINFGPLQVASLTRCISYCYF